MDDAHNIIACAAAWAWRNSEMGRQVNTAESLENK